MSNVSIHVAIILSLAVTLCNASCSQVFGYGLSDADKQSVLGWHNYYRALVQAGQVPGQPKAKNVYPLAWDNALATAAQNIANSCNFGHVTVNDSRFYVGQNLYMSWTTSSEGGTDWNGCVKAWYDEYKNFVYPNTSNGVTGHYTQVVWANTKLLGCGFTWFKDGTDYKKLYVCNYGPGGNYVGQAPYEV